MLSRPHQRSVHDLSNATPQVKYVYMHGMARPRVASTQTYADSIQMCNVPGKISTVSSIAFPRAQLMLPLQILMDLVACKALHGDDDTCSDCRFIRYYRGSHPDSDARPSTLERCSIISTDPWPSLRYVTKAWVELSRWGPILTRAWASLFHGLDHANLCPHTRLQKHTASFEGSLFAHTTAAFCVASRNSSIAASKHEQKRVREVRRRRPTI